jgi:hypothetical protein
MKNYVEWADKKRLIDLKNKYSTLYINEDASMFYIEPLFYTSLQYVKSMKAKDFQKILDEMERLTKKNKLVVFTGDSDEPITLIDEGVHAIFITLGDIAERLNISIESKNFQGDYKD